MNKGVIFVAGTYGVGKSTLCDKLCSKLGISAFSAGDLISEVNGEMYGKNKVVKDKTTNQNILITAVKKKLSSQSAFLLAGHFCIFNQNNEVEILPEFVYKELSISQILLLETDGETILRNIKARDDKTYSLSAIKNLIVAERNQAEKISRQYEIPLYIHKMRFDRTDIDKISAIIQGSVV